MVCVIGTKVRYRMPKILLSLSEGDFARATKLKRDKRLGWNEFFLSLLPPEEPKIQPVLEVVPTPTGNG